MASNASLVLGVLGKEIFGLGKQAEALGGKFNAAKLAAFGAMAAITGSAAIGVMSTLVEKATDFNQQLVQMKMANFAPKDIADLKAQAFQTMVDVPGSNLTDTIKLAQDLRNISGSAAHARELLNTVNRTQLVMANITHRSAEGEGFMFMKFLEDAGLTIDKKTGKFSVEEVEKQNKWMQGVIAGMGGRVTASDLFQLRQSGKASVNTLSEEGLTNLLPALFALKPVLTGTALQGQQQLLGASNLRKHTVEWLEKFGLLNPKKVHSGRGGFYTLDPHAITGEDRLQKDLVGWIWDVVNPALKAKGLLEPTARVEEIKRSGLRTPMLGLMADVIQNEISHKNEIGNIRNSMKVNQYEIMEAESPTFRITKFHEAWTNLMIVLGSPMVDTATGFIQKFTDALNKVTAWATAHPQLVILIEQTVGWISAVLIALGTLAVAVAAGKFIFAPLISIASGISKLATATAAFAGGGAAASGLTAVLVLLTRLSLIGTAIATLWGIAKIGSESETAENRARLEELAKLRQSPSGGPNGPLSDGFDAEGRPVPAPILPPPPAPERHSLLQNNIFLDGRKIAEVVSDYIGRARPNSLPTGGDLRSSGMMPGSAFG